MEAIIGDFEGTASPSSGRVAMRDPHCVRWCSVGWVNGFIPCRCGGPCFLPRSDPASQGISVDPAALVLLLFKLSHNCRGTLSLAGGGGRGNFAAEMRRTRAFLPGLHCCCCSAPAVAVGFSVSSAHS